MLRGFYLIVRAEELDSGLHRNVDNGEQPQPAADGKGDCEADDEKVNEDGTKKCKRKFEKALIGNQTTDQGQVHAQGEKEEVED